MTDDIVYRLRVPMPYNLAGMTIKQLSDERREAVNEIERWRDLAIHAWVHMGMDATCSDDDCEQCQTIKKAWENK